MGLLRADYGAVTVVRPFGNFDDCKMETIPPNSRYNRVLDRALNRPFALTITFVMGAVLLLVASVFVADTFGERIGEDSVVRQGTDQATAEAKLLATSFGRIIANPALAGYLEGIDGNGGTQSPGNTLPSDGSISPLVTLLLSIGENDLSSLFESIDFQHMGLLDTTGRHIWALGPVDGLGSIQKVSRQLRTVNWCHG